MDEAQAPPVQELQAVRGPGQVLGGQVRRRVLRALPLAAGAAASPKATATKVAVKDDFFSPTNVSVAKGGKVVWNWSGMNTQTHNVTLFAGPKGVKKSQFTSTNASSHFQFKKTFEKPGTYRFHCTLHPVEMKMTVKV